MSRQSEKAVINAVVLAAGTSSRFGSSKLVAPFRGRPLLQYALLAAREACKGSVGLVVGHDREAILAAASGLNDTIIENANYKNGIGSSIAAGVCHYSAVADALVIVLADQPLLTGQHLCGLIAAWSGSPDEIVASAYADGLAPPILFPRNAFEQLQGLSGDDGARQILDNGAYRLRTHAVPQAYCDVDVPGDLDSLNAF